MAERESIGLWSVTAATNATVDPSINFAENQLPSTVNNSARAEMAALARYYKDTNGSLTTTGSANAYLLTVNATWTAYANGNIISFKASFSNTSTATINVTNADATALGAKAIRGPGDVGLVAGAIITGGRYILQYDTAANSAAGAWILLNPTVMGRIGTAAELQVAATAGGRWSFGGTITTTAKITVTGDNFELIGDNQFTSVIDCSDVDAPVFEIANDIDVVFESMTIKHTGTPIAGGDGIKFLGITQISRVWNAYVINNYVGLNLGPASYSVVGGQTIVTNNISHGISIAANATSSSLQWHIDGMLSENSGGNNYDVDATGGSPGNATMGNWHGAHSFGGSGYGLRVLGDATHGVFALRVADSFFGGEALACIRFENSYGSRHQISGCYLEQVAAGSGIIADANCLSLYISDTIIAQMGVSGIVSAAPILSVTGGEIASNTSIGIDITAAARVVIDGVDIQSNGTGIRFAAFAVNATITGNNVSSNSTQFTNSQVGGTVRAIGNTGITDTAINGVTVTSATSGTLTIGDSATFSLLANKTLAVNNTMTLAADADSQMFVMPATGGHIPAIENANTWSGVQSFGSGKLKLSGATSGTITVNAAATASTNTITLPAGTTDFSATGGTSQVVKQTSAGGAFTVATVAVSDIAGVAWTSFSPTPSSTGGAFTTSSSSGSYVVLGKIVHFTTSITITTVGGGSGTITLAVPTGTSLRNVALIAKEFAVTGDLGIGKIDASGSSIEVVKYDGSSLIGAGRVIVVTGTYELT